MFLSLAKAVTPPFLLQSAKRFARRFAPIGTNWRALTEWPEGRPQAWPSYWVGQNITDVSAEDRCYLDGGALEVPMSDGIRLNFLAFASIVGHYASTSGGALRILDFGGGFGLFARVAAWAAPGVSIDYHVVEVPDVAELGATLRPDVKFHGRLVDAPGVFDIVIASGALQFEQAWRQLLADLAARTKRGLYLGRMPVVTSSATFVMLQNMPTGGTTHGWAWNFEELETAVNRTGLRVVNRLTLQSSFSPVAGAPEQPVIRSLHAVRN